MLLRTQTKTTVFRRVSPLLVLAASLSAPGCTGRIADLVILDAKIWTGTTRPGDSFASPDEPTALCVVGDRIQAVGSDADIARRIGPATEVIRAGGRRVIPGITDSHTHIVGGGRQLGRLRLRDVRNRSEFVEAVAKVVKKTKRGQWVQGGRWSVESWTDPAPPTKAWLDPITGDTPVFLSRMDGHQALVNSAALGLGRISASGPPDPPGGEIVRDPRTGEPTGILKETAMELVRRMIPPSSLQQRYQDLCRAMAHANALGITSIHDMSEPDDLEVFLRAHSAGTLTLRITSYLSVSDWSAYTRRVKEFPVRDDRLTVAGFKAYMDGSMGSRTAYMHAPYADATPEMPYPRGQLNPMANPPEKFIQAVIRADAAGLQIATHAIGDQANHLLLNAYQATIRANGRRGARHRVEHAQHLMVKDIARFADLGIVASMQPFHKADDGRYAEKRIGPDRLNGSYAYRKLINSGALLCFGSDFPVVTINPFKGIDSAVNARTVEGKVWLPSHSLTLDEALRAYTVSPPKAIHRGDRLGTLEPGKLADIVILNGDPLSQPMQQVGQTQVWRTIVGGKIVYTRQ